MRPTNAQSRICSDPLDRRPVAYNDNNQHNLVPWTETPRLRLNITDDVLFRLSQKDQDICYDYYYNRITQVDLALKYNMTQGAISSRLRRLRQRIKFLMTYSSDMSNISKDLSYYLGERDISIVKYMHKYCSLVKARQDFNNQYHDNQMSQTQFRYQFLKIISNLALDKRYNKKLEGYYNTLLAIRNNLSILSDLDWKKVHNQENSL